MIMQKSYDDCMRKIFRFQSFVFLFRGLRSPTVAAVAAAAVANDDDDDHVVVNRCRCCCCCCSSASLVHTFYAIFARTPKECAKIQKWETRRITTYTPHTHTQLQCEFLCKDFRFCSCFFFTCIIVFDFAKYCYFNGYEFNKTDRERKKREWGKEEAT